MRNLSSFKKYALLGTGAVVVAVVLIMLWGAFEQYMVRRGLGSMTLTVPAGWRVVSATWKDADSLWVHRCQTGVPEEQAECRFGEWSRYGLLEGEVVFRPAQP